MNITYDKALKQRVWQIMRPKLASEHCPFCGKKLSGKNAVGYAWINGEFRAFDKNIICLIQFSDTQKELNSGRTNLFTRAKRTIARAARALGKSIRGSRASGGSSEKDARPTGNRKGTN